MPAPAGQPRLIDAAGHISGQGLVGPHEHRFVIQQDPPQRADRRSIGHGVGSIDVMAIGRGQSLPQHLMHADEQFGRVGRRQHFFDQAVDVRIAKGIDLFERLFLFVQASRNWCAASA